MLVAPKYSEFLERQSKPFLFFYCIIFIYFADITLLVGGDSAMYAPQKRVKLVDTIRSNILNMTGIKDKELAKQIARDWIRKAGG